MTDIKAVAASISDPCSRTKGGASHHLLAAERPRNSTEARRRNCQDRRVRNRRQQVGGRSREGPESATGCCAGGCNGSAPVRRGIIWERSAGVMSPRLIRLATSRSCWTRCASGVGCATWRGALKKPTQAGYAGTSCFITSAIPWRWEPRK